MHQPLHCCSRPACASARGHPSTEWCVSSAPLLHRLSYILQAHLPLLPAVWGRLNLLSLHLPCWTGYVLLLLLLLSEQAGYTSLCSPHNLHVPLTIGELHECQQAAGARQHTGMAEPSGWHDLTQSSIFNAVDGSDRCGRWVMHSSDARFVWFWTCSYCQSDACTLLVRPTPCLELVLCCEQGGISCCFAGSVLCRTGCLFSALVLPQVCAVTLLLASGVCCDAAVPSGVCCDAAVASGVCCDAAVASDVLWCCGDLIQPLPAAPPQGGCRQQQLPRSRGGAALQPHRAAARPAPRLHPLPRC